MNIKMMYQHIHIQEIINNMNKYFYNILQINTW